MRRPTALVRLVAPARPAAGNRRWAAVVAAVSGVLAVGAFPPFGFWPLAAVGVAGLAVAVHGRPAGTAAWLGYLWGWAFFAPLLSWTGVYVGLVWLLLPFAEAAFTAGLGIVLARLWRLPAPAVWIGLAWVAEEAARDRLPFGGFPWGRWAFSQAESPLRWFAALGGAPTVTFAVALAGGGLAVAAVTLLRRRTETGVDTSARRHRWWQPMAAGIALLAAVPVLAAGAGVALRPDPAPAHAVVALIQGNVPDKGLEFNERRRQVLDNHVAQTLRLAADVAAGTVPQPDLVVWPENASDIDPLRNPDARAQIEKAVRAVGVPILVGAILDGPDGDQRINAGILWSPLTGPGAQYVKRHPVPFGEYIPLRSLARLFSKDVDLVPVDMTRGHGNGLITGGPMPIGDVICFEVAYDGLVRSSVRAGAQLLVVQTNNATFGHTAETYQQLAMSQLRAVEHGRVVLQVATSGKSAVIDRSGQVVRASGALFTPAVLVAEVDLSTSTTLATRLGGWPELVWTVLALVGLALTMRPASRSEQAGASPPDQPALTAPTPG